MMYDEDELALLYLNYRVGELARAKGPYQTFNLAPYKTPRELLTKIEGDTDLTAYFNSMKQSLEGNPEYQKRLSTSKQGRKKEIGRLRASISKLEKERADLSRKPLRELFSRESHFDLIPDDLARPADYAELRFDQVKGSPYFGLVPYLIKSGAVDETYGRYASNFYPLSLTARDRDFVTTALQGIAATDPNREIDSPRTVLVHLDDASLGRKQARNYALFKALLEDDCRHELDVLLKGLEADEDLGFLVGYTASRCYTDRLFPYLKQSGSPVVSDVLYTYESLGDERMRSFCHRLASDGGAFLQDEEVARGLRETASADPAFLAPGPAEPGKVAKGLESVGYRPQQIDFDNIDPVLAAEAYQKRLFEPNATNVSGFLSHFGTAEELVSPDRLSNTICEASVLPELEMLKHYVEDNAGLYVSSLTADIEIPINADESTVAWLLNAESLDADSAEPFVAALRGKPVKHLSTIIRREMKSTLMSHGKTAPSANNILDYYSSAGEEFDETLVRFIEDNDPPETLNSALADELIGQDNRFLEDLIKSNVSTKKVVAITGSYGRTFEEFGITGLPEERMNALINIGAIDMTNANLSFIRIYYEDSSPLFASSSIEGYCALVTGKEGTEAQANFNENEVLGIFALPQIDVGFKLYLLDEFDSDIALDESYPEELLAAICKSNLSDADLPNLPMFYESGGKGLKQAIAEAASSRHQQLMNAGVNMQWGMVEHILRCMKNSVDRAGTVELMAWRLGRDDANPPSRSMLRQCFASSGLEPYVKLLDSTGGAVQIPYTSYDKALLEELAELNMCSDKIVGPNEKGFIEAHPKGYTRKKAAR